MSLSVCFVSGNLSRQSGGVFEIQLGLAKSLQLLGVRVEVIGYADADWTEDARRWEAIDATALPIRFPQAIKYAPGYKKALIASQTDIYHAHLMWLYTTIAMRAAIKRNKRPYLYSVHGFINEWTLQRSRWKKILAYLCYEKQSLRAAPCLHVNSWNEYRQVRSFGLKNPIAIIPNGVDPPQYCENKLPPWAEMPSCKEKKILLYFSRLHPKKGIEPLLRAWKKAQHQAKRTGWVLIIAGWGETHYINSLKKWVEVKELNGSVFFPGPQFNAEKAACFRHADAFILPSHSEGLPMAALEALACGLPCLISENCNIPKSIIQQSGWSIQPSVSSIRDGLEQLFSASDIEIEQKITAAQKLAQENYAWDKVAKQMKDVYEWMLDGQPAPDYLIFD